MESAMTGATIFTGLILSTLDQLADKEIVSLILVVVTSLVSVRAFKDHALMQRLIFNPYTIERKNQWERFISSGFIHADWMHLLVNMFVLYMAGSILEKYYAQLFGAMGKIYFLLLYIGGLIFSVLPTFFSKKNNIHYNALGASGAVSAVLFSYILFQPETKLCLYFVLCMPGFVLGIGYLIYSYYAARKLSDNVNHDAHFWGALYGIIFNLLLDPAIGENFIYRMRAYLNL